MSRLAFLWEEREMGVKMVEHHTRRSLIIGAGLAALAPKLVRAESIVEIPWNMRAAQQWAVDSYNEHPGCRLVFADGSTYNWHHYTCLGRQVRGSEDRTFAVAIEVCVTDAKGRRTVNTIPVDGYALTKGTTERDTRIAASRAKKWNELFDGSDF